MESNFKIITYDPKYKAAFKALNIQWIKYYFEVEKKDLEQLDNPEQCLKDGGQIFFVLHQEPNANSEPEVVGTCAMYKIGPNRYELAKMAVNPEFKGKGLGDLLMLESEQWTKQQGATSLLILSNTILAPAISLYMKHGYETIKLGPHPDYKRADIEMHKQI